jgi:SDR family mycofactocin-dependent oxidoreductase
MGKFSGKVALVTGAARGQGRNHAVRLAQDGAAIIAVDICAPVRGISYGMATPRDLEETCYLVEATGAKFISAQVDIRNAQALRVEIDNATSELGGLNIVVANAGVVAVGRSEDFSGEQWDAIIGVNLTGTWNTLRASIPHLITSGGGAIVATASVAGVVGIPFADPYVASKHGIIGLAKALAIEYADKNIRVNVVCPTGVVGTGMNPPQTLLQTASEKLKSTLDNALLIDMVEKSDISEAVAFLVSDSARFVTGSILAIDGGLIVL